MVEPRIFWLKSYFSGLNYSKNMAGLNAKKMPKIAWFWPKHEPQDITPDPKFLFFFRNLWKSKKSCLLWRQWSCCGWATEWRRRAVAPVDSAAACRRACSRIARYTSICTSEWTRRAEWPAWPGCSPPPSSAPTSLSWATLQGILKRNFIEWFSYWL